MSALTPAMKDSIIATAGELRVDPEWLRKLIAFETAGTYDTQIKNKYSSARGLIQFMDATAQGMGYANSAQLVGTFPGFPAQMKYAVLPYLRQFAPFPTEQSLYMAVFYPAARTWDLDLVFPASVQAVNPGIRTVRDYVNKVNGIFETAIEIGGAAIVLIGIAVAFFFNSSSGGVNGRARTAKTKPRKTKGS